MSNSICTPCLGGGCGGVILRSHLNHVAADDVEPGQPSEKLDRRPRDQPADLRRTGARSEHRVEAADVAGDIDRPIPTTAMG